jgi:hypothetical protein
MSSISTTGSSVLPAISGPIADRAKVSMRRMTGMSYACWILPGN